MENILNCLEARGDLSFALVPFCDADALVFCRLAYMPWAGAVPADFQQTVPLSDAIRSVLANMRNIETAFRLKLDPILLTALLDCPRYLDLRISGFVDRFDTEAEKQFAAVTFSSDALGTVIAYRGTDGTLVGWKEDFNMSFADTIPAQTEAVEYLEQATAALPGNLRLCGHSKGGNLAVYAAAFCPDAVQSRIVQVLNLDGPGFNDRIRTDARLQRILPRARTFLPQSSVIGMLLGHAEDLTIVHSDQLGLFQHNIYSWAVRRGRFVTEPGLTNSSQFMDAALKDWVTQMDTKHREQLIDGIYTVLRASNGVTLRDLWNGRNTLAILRAAGSLDSETRAVIEDGLHILRTSMKKSLPELLDGFSVFPPHNEPGEPAEHGQN